jgi:hypothetical protein
MAIKRPLRNSAFILSLTALITFVSCSAKVSTTAIIRVTHGDPPEANSDDHSVIMEETILTSFAFGQHVDEKLELSKLWGLSGDGVVAKLRKAITLRAGTEPGLFVIICNGLEHDVAVKIVNELCTFYTEQQIEDPNTTGKPQKVHVSIVQRAE